jgi:membrane complex biogenesis BtpA family protein
VLDRCLAEAERYADAGVDGLIIENTHDTPYQRVEVDAGAIAGMAICAHEVRRRFDLAVGIQVLAGANVAAIDVAATCELDFVRAEGFVFAHVADEGLIQADAAHILRRRAHVRAEGVEVWADIQKKHSAHALTADLTLPEHAKAAAYCGADGVVVTGGHTGEPPALEEVESVAGHGVRVIVGSGVNMRNIARLGAIADVLIVGSACKEGGCWDGPVDKARVRELLQVLQGAQ